MSAPCEFRHATEEDIPLIIDFIKELAFFDKLSYEITATEEGLREWIFEKKVADVLFALEDGVPVGFVIYYFNFSTFRAQAGLYISDLFVKQEHRGRGYGYALVKEIARIALANDCGRIDWSDMAWIPSNREFFQSLGAYELRSRTMYRLQADLIRQLAEQE